MRIISGNFRGKRINAPANLPARPTTDFAKEALFNVLNNQFYLDEISVLDLFSGIGSISLEFASRGSQRIVSVDQDTGCVKFLAETAKDLKIEDQISVHKYDVFQFLKRNTQGSFDVIFADPPFAFETEDYLKLAELIQENNWLNPDGQLIMEHSKSHKFEAHPNFIQTRKYGNVNFSFFEMRENSEEEI